MESSSALLPPHGCLRHSCLSLKGQRCHSLSSNTTSKAPHRTVNGETADCHHHTSFRSISKQTTGRTRTSYIHWFLLLPLLISLLFEGCSGLVVSNEVLKDIEELGDATPTREGTNESTRVGRTVNTTPSVLWENATVPFVFDKGLPLRSKRQTIKAMCVWMKHTDCIKFVPRTDQQLYIQFKADPSVCDSFVGKISFFAFLDIGQPVKLAWHCTRGDIMHELGHVLGFYHEHERLDRNQYIRVNSSNVIPKKLYKFNINPEVTALGAPYDYDSIMHYPLTAFSINGKPTIEVLSSDYQGLIGQRKKLSTVDKLQTNNIYRCEDPGANTHMMPLYPDIIQDGDWIVLCPLHIDNPRTKHRLECTSDNCTTSTCAGRLFKPNDVELCPQLMISIQKISSQHPLRADRVIRNGDTVSLRWEVSGAMLSAHCDLKQKCTLGCPSDSSDCNEQYSHFTIQVQGKGLGVDVYHRDGISFHRTAKDGAPFVFACSESGLCGLQFCGNCDGSEFLFHLQKY